MLKASRINQIAVLMLMVIVLIVPVGSIPAVDAAPDVDVLVQTEGDSTAVADFIRQAGGEVTGDLYIIDSLAARLPSNKLDALRALPGVKQVSIDQTVITAGSALPDEIDFPAVIDADQVWANGVTGRVTVAVGTGLDQRYTELKFDSAGNKRQLVVVENNQIVQPRDGHGHGTHVTGIIANSGKTPDGMFGGIAPDVNLVVVKVLGDDGSGKYSKVIEGIQWVMSTGMNIISA